MVTTTHKISSEPNDWYFMVAYYEDGVNISYYERDIDTNKFNQHEKHEIFITPSVAKELFKIASKQCEIEYQ